jgi:hypothetical protein
MRSSEQYFSMRAMLSTTSAFYPGSCIWLEADETVGFDWGRELGNDGMRREGDIPCVTHISVNVFHPFIATTHPSSLLLQLISTINFSFPTFSPNPSSLSKANFPSGNK